MAIRSSTVHSGSVDTVTGDHVVTILEGTVSFDTPLKDVPLGLVVDVVASYVHLVIKEVRGCVETCHP